MLLTLSGRSFIKIQYSSFPLFPVAYPFRVATQLQYYVKHEKYTVNDVIFPSGCEACAINLGNKNMKIGIFTGATGVRSKNIFADISRYPTRKPEIIFYYFIEKMKIPGTYGVITGWGGNVQELQQAQVMIPDEETCKKSIKKYEKERNEYVFNTTYMFCAGGKGKSVIP